jgi:glycosyltransferase involved in cell wall biosynthesis
MNVSISQAMACGLPVIATRHSGFPDQVIDGVTGILVPEGDWQALARTIIELAGDPGRWSAMGRAGFEHARKNYDTNQLIEEQIRLYDELTD